MPLLGKEDPRAPARRMWGSDMKKQLNVLCSIIALFCFVSMFMPVIAPRFPAGQYYAADEAIAERRAP